MGCKSVLFLFFLCPCFCFFNFWADGVAVAAEFVCSIHQMKLLGSASVTNRHRLVMTIWLNFTQFIGKAILIIFNNISTGWNHVINQGFRFWETYLCFELLFFLLLFFFWGGLLVYNTRTATATQCIFFFFFLQLDNIEFKIQRERERERERQRQRQREREIDRQTVRERDREKMRDWTSPHILS